MRKHALRAGACAAALTLLWTGSASGAVDVPSLSMDLGHAELTGGDEVTWPRAMAVAALGAPAPAMVAAVAIAPMQKARGVPQAAVDPRELMKSALFMVPLPSALPELPAISFVAPADGATPGTAPVPVALSALAAMPPAIPSAPPLAEELAAAATLNPAVTSSDSGEGTAAPAPAALVLTQPATGAPVVVRLAPQEAAPVPETLTLTQPAGSAAQTAEPAPVPAVPAIDPAPSASQDAEMGPPSPTSPDALQVAAPGEVESLRDTIIAALKNNPDIQIALAQQDDARYGIHEAEAAYLPHVDVTVGYGPEIARAATAPQTERRRFEGTVSLNQNLWDWGVTINDIKRARASYRAAQWATREQIEAISFDISNAYLGMLQQQKLIALTNDEIAATKKILRMVTVQKDLGLTTQADVDRAKARVENIQSVLLDRQSQLQQARDAYRRLTNRVPGVAVDLPPSASAMPDNVDDAIDMIDTNSPRMAQAVQDRRSLDRQYASQTGTFLPRVGLSLQGNHRYDVLGKTGEANDARAMVTMSYSFLNGGADVAVRNRIRARLRQADYELDRRRREVEQDIRADFQSLGAARQKIDTINAEIASAERVSDLYKQQFREGKRSVFDLLDSQQVLFSARGNAVANEIAMRLAEYRVLQKLGGLFDLVSAGEPLPPLVVPAPVKTAAK